MLVSDEKANNYLKNIIKVLKPYENQLDSIILFGSHARGEPGPFSDVDLLIVFKKRDKEIFKKIISRIRFLELKFGYTKKSANIIELCLAYLNVATGMFRSWFLCSSDDLKNMNFSKITSINTLISKILAPSSLVLDNILRDGKVIVGNKELLHEIPHEKKSTIQPFRSILMNSLLSIGALIISPFTKTSQYYSLEAIKWSLFVLNEINIKSSLLPIGLKNHLRIYYNVKKTGSFNPYLPMKAPIIIYRIHRHIFHELKKIKMTN